MNLRQMMKKYYEEGLTRELAAARGLSGYYIESDCGWIVKQKCDSQRRSRYEKPDKK